MSKSFQNMRFFLIRDAGSAIGEIVVYEVDEPDEREELVGHHY